MAASHRSDPRSLLAVGSLVGTWLIVAVPVLIYQALSEYLTSPLQQVLLLCACGSIPALAIIGVVLIDLPTRQWQAQLLVFSEFAGLPVDVARLGAQRQPLRARVFQSLLERARTLAATSYRTAYVPETEWDRMCLDPRLTDRSLLRAALTLTRLDLSLAGRAERGRLRTLYQALWARLLAVEPQVLDGGPLRVQADVTRLS